MVFSFVAVAPSSSAKYIFLIAVEDTGLTALGSTEKAPTVGEQSAAVDKRQKAEIFIVD